jgi:hypothetical protein
LNFSETFFRGGELLGLNNFVMFADSGETNIFVQDGICGRTVFFLEGCSETVLLSIRKFLKKPLKFPLICRTKGMSSFALNLPNHTPAKKYRAVCCVWLSMTNHQPKAENNPLNNGF